MPETVGISLEKSLIVPRQVCPDPVCTLLHERSLYGSINVGRFARSKAGAGTAPTPGLSWPYGSFIQRWCPTDVDDGTVE